MRTCYNCGKGEKNIKKCTGCVRFFCKKCREWLVFDKDCNFCSWDRRFGKKDKTTPKYQSLKRNLTVKVNNGTLEAADEKPKDSNLIKNHPLELPRWIK